MEVGVRELKARLSEYLDRAASGETILVTDRGRPKALLTRPTAAHRIEQGIREGWIRPARGRLRREPLGLRPEMTVAEAMAEDRHDD